MLVKIPFVGSHTEELQRLINPAQTINLYQVVHGTSPVRYMRTFPGLSEIKVTLSGKSNVRALYVAHNRLYVVGEDTIYSLDANLTLTVIGSITTTSGYVGIAANERQVIFVDGAAGWLFDSVGSTFAQIIAAGFPTLPTDVTWMDGFFLATRGETGEWNKSAFGDGTKWDALDFEIIESRPDLIQALHVLHRNIYVFGKETTEVWYNAGAVDFPFRRNNGLLLEFGTVARGTVSSGHGRLFWLAGNARGVGSIMMSEGTAPIVISTPNIDAQLQTYADIEEARGYTYKYDGHLFYEVSFGTANVTWTYDVLLSQLTGIPQWYKKSMSNGDRFVGDVHAFFNNKHYIGAHNAGEIYEMSNVYHKYVDDPLRRIRISLPFQDEMGRKVQINKIFVDFLRGSATTEYPDDEPELLLSYSKDGGYCYDTIKRVSLGKIGQFNKRLIIDRLGCSGGDEGLSWIFKAEFYGNTPFLLGDMIADVEVLKT